VHVAYNEHALTSLWLKLMVSLRELLEELRLVEMSSGVVT
jgi:hypothetical protein